MRVIKKQTKHLLDEKEYNKEITCGKCGSALSYTRDDEQYYCHDYYIKCPVCKNEIVTFTVGDF